MSQELRNRTGSNVSHGEMHLDDSKIFTMSSGLSARTMVLESPFHHGTIWKLHVPVLYSFSPAWIQRILSSWICPNSFAPKWKQRYLIAIGKYIYRFNDEVSSDPKGMPIEMQRAQANVISSSHSLEDGMELPLQRLPPGCTAVFKVSIFGKDQYFAVSNKEEALTWTNSIQQGRQETITRIMGHAEHTMYPKSWEYFDKLGDEFTKRKDRIKQKLYEANKRDVEFTNLTTLSGTEFRGHYG